MDKPVLIVVDMQAAFEAANCQSTIDACKKLITSAKIQDNPIVFVEYKWNGPTLPSLMKLVHGYEYKNHVTKESDDGSNDIQRFFYRCRIAPKNLILCGVNTNFCVLETVIGLRRKGYDITVVARACNTIVDADFTGASALQYMQDYGVKVI